MKLVLIAYNEAVDEEVMRILQEVSVESYTKWTKVLGKGERSGPHLMTHVWPKANNVLAAVADDETAAKLLDGVRELRGRLAREGIKAFSWQVEDAT